jgi:hypothetical protein
VLFLISGDIWFWDLRALGIDCKHLTLTCLALLMIAPTIISPAGNQKGLERQIIYRIDLLLDFNSLLLKANQSVLFNLPKDIEDICFKVYPNAFRPDGWIEITEVRVAGVPIEGFRFTEEDNTTLVIPIPRGISYDKRVKVDLSYVIKVPKEEDRFGYFGGIMALGNWFPILAVLEEEEGVWISHPYVNMGESFYSECADFLVTIRVEGEEDFVIAATGSLVEQYKAKNMTVQTWRAKNVRDFALTVSPDYEVYETTWENVTIYSYYIPEHEESGVLAAKFASRCLQVFSEVFGRYPYAELRVAEVNSWFGGMEYPGIVFISSKLYSNGNESFMRDLLQRVIAHEVAHQWWYGVVGNDQYEDPWLDEALAEYSSMLYYRFVYGDKEFRRVFEEYVANGYYIYLEEGIDLPIATAIGDFPSIESYNAIVYSKGAMVFRLLNSLIGDEAFFKALSSYYEQKKFGIAVPEDLIEAFEGASGMELDWFFNRWFFESGIPSYEVINASSQRVGEGYVVRVVLRQNVSEGSLFSLPVTLEFVCTEGLNFSYSRWVNKTLSTLEFQLPCSPSQIIVDPEDVIPGRDFGWGKVETIEGGNRSEIPPFVVLLFLLIMEIVALLAIRIFSRRGG